MNAKRTLDSDHDLFAAMILQAKVSIWDNKDGRDIPELCEYAVHIEKFTPHSVKVRYVDGTVGFFPRARFDFYMLA